MILSFFFVNFIKKNFQQNIKSIDWWKITFVIFHRKQKWLIVFIMNFVNTSNFFQHRMKKLLFSYLWQFVLIYINDIIICFFILNQHIQHLNQILILLKNNEIILTFSKCHFVYFNIKILKHHVFRFDLNITKKNKRHSSNEIFRQFEKIKNEFRIFWLLS